MALEAWEHTDFLSDLWAWQVEVMRTLEHLDRMLSRLPVPSATAMGPLALQGPREGPPLGDREPEVDLVQSPQTVFITLEMPGVEKEEIDLTITEDVLTVKVDSPRRRYYREVPLPPGLDPEGVEASYRHGVLDIAIGRRIEGRNHG